MAKKAPPTSASARKNGRKEVAFVIMPFGGWLDDYYDAIYAPALERAGLEPHRADDLFRPSTIVNDIWNYTKKAKLLLADLTGKNPNVFYELGLAHALAKPAILIAESMDDIPFDLRALRIIVYDKNAPDWGKRLHDKIVAAAKEVLASPVDAVLPAFLDVKNASTTPSVSTAERQLIEMKQELDLVKRELRASLTSGSLHRDPQMPASEARTTIRALIRGGASDDAIKAVLRPRGVPEDWLIQAVGKMRNELLHEGKPDGGMQGPQGAQGAQGA